MKITVFWNRIVTFASCLLFIASASVIASEPGYLGVELTEEQSHLLNGYHQPAQANFNMNSLSVTSYSAVPLVSFQFTAETKLMKGNALELGANYSAWSVDPVSAQIDVTSVGATFTLQAPIQQAMDFSQSIREKVELCPEKIIDKMLIDGSVAINYSW